MPKQAFKETLDDIGNGFCNLIEQHFEGYDDIPASSTWFISYYFDEEETDDKDTHKYEIVITQEKAKLLIWKYVLERKECKKDTSIRTTFYMWVLPANASANIVDDDDEGEEDE